MPYVKALSVTILSLNVLHSLENPGDNLRLAYPHPFPVSHWSVRGVGERGKKAGVRVAPGQAGCGSVQPAWGGGSMLATPVERQPPASLPPASALWKRNCSEDMSRSCSVQCAYDLF